VGVKESIEPDESDAAISIPVKAVYFTAEVAEGL